MEYNFLEKMLESAPMSECGTYQILMRREDQTKSNDLFFGSKKLSKQMVVESIVIYKLWDNISGELVDGIEYPERKEGEVHIGNKKIHISEFKHPSGRSFMERLDRYVVERQHYFYRLLGVRDKLTLTLNKASYRRLMEHHMLLAYPDPSTGISPHGIVRYRGIHIEVSEDLQQEFLISTSEPSLF